LIGVRRCVTLRIVECRVEAGNQVVSLGWAGMEHLSQEEQLALIVRTLRGDEGAFVQLRMI